MERLTEKVFGFVQLKACGNDFCRETCAEHDEEKSCKNCHIQKAFEKLAEYEDLDEQGLLLRLPCKVGDTVYLIKSDGKIVPREADMQFLGVLWEDYGKEWFLTQTEAEQKLKEMESD